MGRETGEGASFAPPPLSLVGRGSRGEAAGLKAATLQHCCLAPQKGQAQESIPRKILHHPRPARWLRGYGANSSSPLRQHTLGMGPISACPPAPTFLLLFPPSGLERKAERKRCWLAGATHCILASSFSWFLAPPQGSPAEGTEPQSAVSTISPVYCNACPAPPTPLPASFSPPPSFLHRVAALPLLKPTPRPPPRPSLPGQCTA